MLQMSCSGMQLLIKVKACVMLHLGSMWVRFLACEFPVGRSSLKICHKELEQLDFED